MNTPAKRPLPARLPLLAVFCLISLAAFSSTAQAECSYPDAAQVFSPWKDRGYYQLAPDGNFESGGAGWTLGGEASLIHGDETNLLNGPEDQIALNLPFGSSATSPPVCVDDSTPSFRAMAQNVGDKGAHLRITVTYEFTHKTVKAHNTDIHGNREWNPTPPVKLDTDGEGERIARISFTSKDPKGVWLVDDLYVDPFARR